jgi:hypothetical protein
MSERESKMQISRHWRLNSQRYRLQGVKYEDGTYSLQNRPNPLNNQVPKDNSEQALKKPNTENDKEAA